MKIDKIIVLETDNKLATDISIFVDNYDFLLEVNKLRQKWNITTLYKLRTSPWKQILDVDSVINNTKEEFKNANERRAEFNADIDQLLQKCKRGKNFRVVAQYAILTGLVPKGVYKSCYFDVVTIGESADLSNPERYEYVIVLSPRTQKKEVEEAYRQFKEHIKGKLLFDHQKNLDYYNPEHRDVIEQFHPGNIYDGADMDRFQDPRELNRTREWYWMRFESYFNGLSKRPKTYRDIIEDWNHRCKVFGTKENQHIKQCPYCSVGDESNIEHALGSYSKLLNNPKF